MKKKLKILDEKGNFTPEAEIQINKNKEKMSKKELIEYNLVLDDIKLHPCYYETGGCLEHHKGIYFMIIRTEDNNMKKFWLCGYILLGDDILKIINKDYKEILDKKLHGGSTCGSGGLDCAHNTDYYRIGKGIKKGDKYRNYEYIKKNIEDAIDTIVTNE